MGNVPMHEWKMPLKNWGMVSTLSGPLGLLWCGANRLPKRPGNLVILSHSVMSKLHAYGVLKYGKCSHAEWKIPLKYLGMVPTLSGSLGLPWCGSHRLTKCPGYLVLLLCLVKSCCVQTNCPCHVQSKAWALYPCMSGRCPYSIGACFHFQVGRWN